MATGAFDPWLGFEAGVRREEEARLAAAAASRPRLTIRRDSSPEQVARFRALVSAESESLEDAVERRLEEWGPREERLRQDLLLLWRDALWMHVLPGAGFPNGRPLWEQRAVLVEIWGVMLGAIAGRENGGSAGAQERGSAGAQETAPSPPSPLPCARDERRGEG